MNNNYDHLSSYLSLLEKLFLETLSKVDQEVFSNCIDELEINGSVEAIMLRQQALIQNVSSTSQSNANI